MVPERIRRFVEHVLPWYDPELERQRAARSAALAARGDRARDAALRAGYSAYGRRLDRRR